ncbi:hypothetical protein ASPWEDRAFT_171661 [Aspergillus wentii DTO 134E9]|uniref:Uncharacterized protein n=1 Tax=Aspergillus wentii DTO 134E9 TaxID=1073089 RepID=A0A1L9RIS4_ASPWE|nr:uncharacterized protein ASPWEDRAFT_171661 [Aspergillus wentii DTO 134E9]KAI9932212.1 hypothetical protein MW887_009722 [Aspergillus wentii]OJJ34825.1 hypothetical protein ASPWEDRAFT_171661 [Aspergillus wentii DTO 134E9]
MVGSNLAAEVAEIFDEAQVPHLLWGHLALALIGDDCHPSELEFVIPDEQIKAASDTLYEAGFCICGKSDCPELRTNQFYPIADVHFHLEGMTEEHHTLSLFSKSSMVWWLPDFSLGPLPKDDPHFILSTDPRLPPRKEGGGSGPWTHLYPIRILNSNIMTEALILLGARDRNQINGLEEQWCRMLIALMEDREVPNTGVKKVLSPRFMPFWEALHQSSPPVGPWDMLWQLGQEMRANNELPPGPAYNAYGTIEWARFNEVDI